MSMDPMQFFDKMTNGKDVWVRSEITSPFMQGMFDRIAERLGITNGQITREQFQAYSQQRAAERAAGGAPPAPPGVPSTGPTPPGGPPPGAGGGDPSDQWAESFFRRQDANGDGLLNYDEMSETLRVERDRWDTNKDGFIDLNEYKSYFRARMEQRAAERGGSGMPWPSPDWAPPNLPPPIEEEEQKPVVYRTGKLPKELPGWFKQLDSDEDAQIGLYEWKSSGRPLDEFLGMDRNGDGFLTVAEVLRFEAQKKTATVQAGSRPTSGGTGPPGTNSGGFSRSGFGGGPPGGGGFSRGGFGNSRGGPPSGGSSGGWGKGRSSGN
jgi:hypothetical protein